MSEGRTASMPRHLLQRVKPSPGICWGIAVRGAAHRKSLLLLAVMVAMTCAAMLFTGGAKCKDKGLRPRSQQCRYILATRVVW